MVEILLAELSTLGGPVLIVLLLSSFVALATTIYKLVQFYQLGVGSHRAGRRALAAWRNADEAGALDIARRDKAVFSSVIDAAMSSLVAAPGEIALARQAGLLVATAALANLNQHLRIIETIVQAAPMLGLLGTVIGMIDAFGRVSAAGGSADPASLANGIWVALTTTAAGLTVAIPFYFVSAWLDGRVEGERSAMDMAIAEITNVR